MNNTTPQIEIYGAGLAGCEAAFQAVRYGVHVRLYEIKPKMRTPAHNSDNFAELVCSNSFRSAKISNAVGLLKEELRRMGSLIIEAADATAVPAGSALAVDRTQFSEYITNKIRNCDKIEIINEEVTQINKKSICIVATGPLTTEPFSAYIMNMLGSESLHFFDAAAPIVDFSSINMEKAFFASRYDKGEASYINCPMSKEEYDCFYDALVNARVAELKDFDREAQKDMKVFEGCMPIEVMAKRGYDTLRFGPLKPVGLVDPKTGKEAFAVVQLRQDNSDRTMYNMVGFQTNLAFEEQRRVFRLIPGLESAEFLRYGVMHRNTYINSPELLTLYYTLRTAPNVFFAGQITGVEGYVESTSSGLVAGINAARCALGLPLVDFTRETVTGALAHYISLGGSGSFQPMNANFGIVSPLGYKVRGGKTAKNEAIAQRALDAIDRVSTQIQLK
ncbi:MAG: methylenetetrahydrofolate--tRNA-(uracil(54)-C(5))-methyltransferase (FADH(2)-oxidizing) TrmFO [Clostridiales bacterium]|nr:methylenetetrahydrofolate--tRNA-(uracil(54)-C(5))-methyltransferase (FADH(2)-oxidizing) TrmFO [Clostridiales bacterium]